MSSEVAICNLALSHLGDEAGVEAISPPDGSVQAAHCGRFYPIARDMLLEAHPWTFAVKRTALSEVTNPAPDDWSYAYALPTGCLRPLSCLLPGHPERLLGADSDAGTHPYIIEAGENGNLVMFTNVESATLRFIARVTDTTKYTPGFVVALARLLASHLAGPIIKGSEGMQVAQVHMKLFAAEYAQAAARNANVGKRTSYQTRQPDWTAARDGHGWSTFPDARILP